MQKTVNKIATRTAKARALGFRARSHTEGGEITLTLMPLQGAKIAPILHPPRTERPTFARDRHTVRGRDVHIQNGGLLAYLL